MAKKKSSNWLVQAMSFILVAIILYLAYKTFEWLNETPEIDAVDLEL